MSEIFCKLCGGTNGFHYEHCTNVGDQVSENPEWKTHKNRFGHKICPLCVRTYDMWDSHQAGCPYSQEAISQLKLRKAIEGLNETIETSMNKTTHLLMTEDAYYDLDYIVNCQNRHTIILDTLVRMMSDVLCGKPITDETLKELRSMAKIGESDDREDKGDNS